MPVPVPASPAAPPTLPPTSSRTLRTALTGRFEVAPVRPSDAPALFALVRDCDVAVLGYPDVSLEDVEFDLADLPSGEPRPQALVRDEGGRVVAWWWTEQRPRSPHVFADVYVDLALREADGDGIAQAGWAAVLAWAHRYCQDPAHLDPARRPEALLATGVLQGDDNGGRRLRAAGLTRVRTFWRMHAPAEPVGRPEPAVPAGVTLEPATDPRLVHRLREETFAEHWGHEPETFEDWLQRVTTQPGYDPLLWRVARVDGEAAAFQICSRQMAGEDALYVATLGTRPAYRGRGIASALLGEAFRLARREGFGSVRLSVDSDSPTGAPSVYRRAGFDVLFALDACHRRLGLS